MRRSWLSAVEWLSAVAATVLAASGCGSSAPKAGVRVECRATDGGNVARDSRVVLERAQRISGHASVAVRADRIVATVPATSPDSVRDLCTSATLELRGLIAPAVTVNRAGTGDPLAGLGFAVPTTPAAYDALTPAQQAKLQSQLASTDCSRVTRPAPTAAQVACDGSKVAYLFGAVIVDGAGVQDADAVAPVVTTSASLQRWTISLSLTASAQAIWSDYTAAHNTNGSTGSVDPSRCGATSTIPCGDFVGFVLNGTVLSIPVLQAAITSSPTQISGPFDKAKATRLVGQIRAGQLPVQLTLVRTATTK